MFHMHDDAKILAVSSAAALSAVVAALLLARWILAPARPTARRVGGARRRQALRPRARAGPGASWPRSAAPSTPWPARSSGCSRPGGSWSPGRATTCGRRSRRCRRCSRRIEDGLAEPASTCRCSTTGCRRCRRLVDDLFELARIDAGVLTSHVRKSDLAPRRRVVRAELRGRGPRQARQPRQPAASTGPARSVRARQGRASAPQPAHERASPHALRRGHRGRRQPRRRRGDGGGRGHGRGRGRGRGRARSSSASGAASRRGPRRLGARPRDRPRTRRGAGRPHLGREPAGGGARVAFTLPAAAS